MTLEEFLAKYLDSDRVLFDCEEVEQLIRKAWEEAVVATKSPGTIV